ncbi:MAG TPA: hypothetical protein PKG52_12695 [bacterium]|nr:hypothetical protein [bacterium]HPS29892.1 hypothetical protein [bacterium]
MVKKVIAAVLLSFLLSCDRERNAIDNETVDEDDQSCKTVEITPALPVKPVLPDVAEIPEYSEGFDKCKVLPEITENRLTLGEGCFKGCIFANELLEISGAGSDKTIIVCDNPEKNGVIEVQKSSEVIVRNLSISGKTRGVFVNNNSKLQIENIAIFNVEKGGINVCGGESLCGSEVTVTGSKISDVIPDAQSGVSYGISMGPGLLTVQNSQLSGFNSFAISLWGEPASKVYADMNNVTISDIYGGKTDFEGTAFYSEGLSEVSIKKVSIEKAATSFIYISSTNQTETSTVVLEDISVEKITDSDKKQGGFVFEGNIKAELKRVEIIKSRGNGIFSNGSEIIAEDITISGVTSDKTGENGFGVSLFDGSISEFNRIVMTEAEIAGIFMDGKCIAEIEDFSVSNTKPDSAGEFGLGAAIQEQAEIIMKNGIINENLECGIMAINGKVEINNVEIKNTMQRKCIELNGCSFAPGIPFGHGISLYQNSQLVFGNISIFNNRNGMNIENSKIYQKNEGAASFVKNVSAVNAWNIEQSQILENAFVNSEFCDNGSVFTTDVQPVRDGL